MKLRAVIIDDEDLAIDLLAHFLKLYSNLELLKTFTNPKNGLEYINQLQPEVLFIDIQMPQLNGIKLIEGLNYSPIVVLVTAYSEHASKAYELDVVDYLLKPYTKDRFIKSLDKIMQFSKFKYNSTNQIENHCIYLKQNGLQKKVNYSDILFVEGLKQYVRIVTNEGKYITLNSMKSLEDLLNKYQFIRVHKSYIVNMAKVNGLTANTIKLENFELPIGRSYKVNLKKHL